VELARAGASLAFSLIIAAIIRLPQFLSDLRIMNMITVGNICHPGVFHWVVWFL
jgi:hypothetical protein